MSEKPHLFIFELQHHSHSASFVSHWADQWRNNHNHGRLTIMLDRAFLDLHPYLSNLSTKDGAIQIIATTRQEREQREAYYARPGGRTIEYFHLLDNSEPHWFAPYYEWELFCDYHNRLNATHSVMAFMDHYLSLLARAQCAPSLFSGVWFRPIFHLPPSDASDIETFRAHQLREKIFLARALRQTNLHSLFVIDDQVIDAVRNFDGGKKVAYLPEVASVKKPAIESLQQLKQKLQTGDRIIFLVFGHLTQNKNIDRFLYALHLLPEDVVRKIALLLVGFIRPNYQSILDNLIEQTESALPVQIIRRYGYASELEVSLYLHAADVVVTLYDEQHGPSNVNLIAASAGTPVLTTNQGIIGRTAEKWELGLTVDVTGTEKIAAGIQRIIQKSTAFAYKDDRMRKLSARHTPENFAKTFYRRLGFFP